jgi:hypothetical protein
MLILASWLDHLFQMPIVIFVVGGLIAVVGIVSGCVTKIAVSRSREQTRREIAAYIAEGTIDADKGIVMMKAGEKEAEV